MAGAGAEQEPYVNREDGMRDAPGVLRRARAERGEAERGALMLTGLHADVFSGADSERLKAELERACREVSDAVAFRWLPSFGRLRVEYGAPGAARHAALARARLHGARIARSRLRCYYAQVGPAGPSGPGTLRPPRPVKQFLISPPSSPPLGWRPREEAEPLACAELLAALAGLAPGETRQLHAPAPGQPAIVVHAALRTAGGAPSGPRIVPTRCPHY